MGYLLALERDVVLDIQPAEQGKGAISIASDSTDQNSIAGASNDGSVASRLRDLAVKGTEFFAGLGFRQPAQEAVKVLLSVGVSRTIDEHIAVGVDVRKRLGISRQLVFKLQRREFSSFSLGDLIEYLVILDHDIAIHVLPSRQPTGVASVNYPTKMIPTLFPTLFMPLDQSPGADAD